MPTGVYVDHSAIARPRRCTEVVDMISAGAAEYAHTMISPSNSLIPWKAGTDLASR